MVSSRAIKAKIRKEMEAKITARSDAAIEVARAVEQVKAAEATLEEARGIYADAAAKALTLMSATELAGLIDTPAGEIRAAAKRRTSTPNDADTDDSPQVTLPETPADQDPAQQEPPSTPAPASAPSLAASSPAVAEPTRA